MSCTGHRDAFPRHDSASTSSAKTLLSPLTFAKYTPASRRSSERWEAGRLQGRSAALPTPLQHLRPNLRVRTHPEPLQKSTQPSTTTASSSASPLATGVTPALQANIHPTSTLPDRPSLRSAHPPSSYNPVKLYDDAPRRSYERWRSSPIKTNALGIGEEEAVVFSRRHSTIGSEDALMPHASDMNIAVISAADVGHNSSLQQVFDLPNDAAISHKPNYYSLRNAQYAVRFSRFTAQDLRYTEKGRISWTTHRNTQALPQIHAAIIIYEVTKPDGLLVLPRILDALKGSSLPVVLVPSRCVQFASIRTTERDSIEESAKALCDGRNVFHVAESQSELQKRCVSVLLVRCFTDSRAPSSYRPWEPSSMAGQQERQKTPPSDTRTRADSKLSMRTKPHSSSGTNPNGTASDRSSSSSCGSAQVLKTIPDENTGASTNPSSQAPSPICAGLTLHDLARRLLRTPSTAADSMFSASFFTIYRLVVAPSELLQAIINQAELRQDRRSSRNLTSQFEYPLDRGLNAIEEWLQDYPSDFADPTTVKVLCSFLDSINATPTQAVVRQRISARLADMRKMEADGKNGPTVAYSVPQLPFTATTYQQFMALPDSTIAQTLVSTSHHLFTTLPLRDLLRHAMPSSSSTSTALTSLTYHFNHLAHFTTVLLLSPANSTPSTRAVTLQKIMRIARLVRQQNDYNSLAALMAGMQATPVHRLRQTWDMVDAAQMKDYKSLCALVGAANDWPSYRLAWENTSERLGRVPFIAVHQRDVVLNCAKMPTFIDSSVGASLNGPQAAPGTSEPRSAESSFSTTFSASSSSGPSTANTSFTSYNSNPTSPIFPQPPPQHHNHINNQKLDALSKILYPLITAQSTCYNPPLAAEPAVRALVLDTAVETDEEVLYERSCNLEPAVSAGFQAQTRAGYDVAGGSNAGGTGRSAAVRGHAVQSHNAGANTNTHWGTRNWFRGLGKGMSEW